MSQPSDRSLRKEDLEHLLRQLQLKRDTDSATEEHSRAVEVTAALGTETNHTVLLDIRQQLLELNRNAAFAIQMASDAMQQSKTQHTEMMSAMLDLSQSIRMMGRSGGSASPVELSAGSATPLKTTYYDSDGKIVSTHQVIGCVLSQVDTVIQRITNDSGTDSVLVDSQKWTQAVKAVARVGSIHSNMNQPVKLPKVTAGEVIRCMETVASTQPGRSVTLRPSHIRELASTCPDVMGIAEEVRHRILLCPGLIGSVRAKRLATISYPYFDANDEVIPASAPVNVGSKIVISMIAPAKYAVKEAYAKMILEDGMMPRAAMSAAIPQ